MYILHYTRQEVPVNPRRGYKQSSFVEKALREQMEREDLKDDIFDLVSLRSQEVLARPESLCTSCLMLGDEQEEPYEARASRTVL